MISLPLSYLLSSSSLAWESQVLLQLDERGYVEATLTTSETLMLVREHTA